MDVYITCRIRLVNWMDEGDFSSQEELEEITKDILDEEGLADCADLGVGCISTGDVQILKIELENLEQRYIAEYIKKGREQLEKEFPSGQFP